MEISVRPLEASRWRDLALTMCLAFGWDESRRSEDDDAADEALYEADRSRCAFDGKNLVGTLGAYSFEMTVPGGTFPTAGTTAVSVLPTHRRQGLLRAMMTAHLRDAHERNEPLAALWASESIIYGRFGYGLAVYRSEQTIEREHTRFARPIAAPGRLRIVSHAEALTLFPPLYERVRRARPGFMSRGADWWQHHALGDSASGRAGHTPFRHVVYEEDGELRGSVVYRSREGNTSWLRVRELQGVDGTAQAALYDFLFGVDLVDKIQLWNQPVDGVLPWLLADPRRLERKIADSLWVRLVDVPTALAGRAYACDGRLTLAVRDAVCPWNDGTYALEVEAGAAKCSRIAAVDPDITLDVADLGAVYLGGNRLQSIAQSGRIGASPEALARADAMFAWDPLPWCPEVF